MENWLYWFIKEIAKLMSSVQSHQTSNPNSIAQKAAYEAIVGPQTSVQSMVVEFEKRMNYMMDRILAINISAVKPQGAFYFLLM